MSKKTNPKRPGRGTKGAHNPLLPQELQGRHYAVRAFVVQPEITLYTADGKEERRFAAQVNLNLFESNFGKSIPEFMEANGLKMEGGAP